MNRATYVTKSKLIPVFLACIAAGIAWRMMAPKKAKSPRPPIAVTVLEVTTAPIVTKLESIGTAVSNESADIISNVTQTIASIHFDDCQTVKKGDVLVQLNVDRKNAEKKQIEANLQEQQRELRRQELLKAKKLAQGKDYDTQYSAWLKAKASLEAIEAEIKESTIVAPFDGVLGFRRVSVGSLLTAGTVITTIDDISRLKIDFTIPEKYSQLIHSGMMIKATCIAVPDKIFSGQILSILPRISSISRSISVRGTIDNPNAILKPGMMLKISLQLKERIGIKIPEKSIITIGDQYFVYILTDKNKVKRQEISVGEHYKGYVEITKGITPGLKVIVEGAGLISEGMTVNVVTKRK